MIPGTPFFSPKCCLLRPRPSLWSLASRAYVGLDSLILAEPRSGGGELLGNGEKKNRNVYLKKNEEE